MENEMHRPPATPEEIWNILRTSSEKSARQTEELKKLFKETREQMKETDRRMKEIDRRIEEIDRRMEEHGWQVKETDRWVDEWYGPFDSPWRRLLESLVEGDLVPVLQARGIAVRTTHSRVSGRHNGELYEYDILAASDAEVVVVEVRTTLRAEDVTQFLPRLEQFTGWSSVYRGWRIVGAVAYLQADHSVLTHAERQGLYVIRATGSSASIINQDDFQPRVFA